MENLREGVSLPQWDVSASGVTSGPVVLAEVMPVFMELTMMQRPTPKQASDLGDRIILAPLAINPRLADTAIHQLARDFADGNRKGDSTLEADPVNVVILVPSDAAAARWESVADATLRVNDMGPTIDRLIKGEHIGVVVLVNKYDGVDLPGKACRLLIIAGVPSPTDRGADRRRGHRRDPRSTGPFPRA